MKESSDFIPTRQSLLSRLRNRADEDGWNVFFNTYWRLIHNAAIRAGLTDAEAHDVVQETLLSVLKSMPRFHYNARKGSFKNWLMQLTKWRIADQWRRRDAGGVPLRYSARGSSDTPTVERLADPRELEMEADWDREWQANLMERALENVKGKVDPQDYQIFHLRALKRWPVPKVARALNVSAAKVYLVKFRVGNLAKQELARLKKRAIWSDP